MAQRASYSSTNTHVCTGQFNNSGLNVSCIRQRLPHQWYSAQELQIDGVKQTKHNWTSLQQHWLAELRELITEIRQGHCQPTPQASMCKTCDYQSLCRVKQLEIEQDNE